MLHTASLDIYTGSEAQRWMWWVENMPPPQTVLIEENVLGSELKITLVLTGFE